ncbi:MAG: helix-turn-helix domain-containing protein [Nanoarchaeota archaeon]
MNELREILERLGLSPGEAKIYLALLQIGVSSVGPIISKSGVSGSKAYKILDRLIEKGLVSSIEKENVRQFKAESPEKLQDIVRKKEEEIRVINKELEKNMDFLLEKAKLSESQSNCTVYQGFEGMKSCFDLALKELKKGDKMYVLGITESTEQIRDYFIHFYKKQEERGFKVEAIFDETGKYKSSERKNKLASFGFLPKGIVTPATIVIYHDKVIIEVGKAHFILTISIKNKEIADSFKVYFEQLWKMAKK